MYKFYTFKLMFKSKPYTVMSIRWKFLNTIQVPFLNIPIPLLVEMWGTAEKGDKRDTCHPRVKGTGPHLLTPYGLKWS